MYKEVRTTFFQAILDNFDKKFQFIVNRDNQQEEEKQDRNNDNDDEDGLPPVN